MGRLVKALKIGLPVGIVGTAAVFAASGNWPWHRLQEATPIVVSRAFTESQDTLQEGETLSDLFARNNVGDPAISALTDSGEVDPRRLRPGVVFFFRQDVTDSVPSQVFFRSSPDSRMSLDRTGETWDA